MTQEEADPERKGSAPPAAPPHQDACSCLAPEPKPASGELTGREEEVLREGQKKMEARACPCSLLQLKSATWTWEAGLSRQCGSSEAQEPAGISIKAKPCTSCPSVCLSSGQFREIAPWHLYF